MSRRHKTYTNCRIVNKSFYMEAKPFTGFFWKGCARPLSFVVNAGRDNFLDGPYPVLGQKKRPVPGGWDGEEGGAGWGRADGQPALRLFCAARTGADGHRLWVAETGIASGGGCGREGKRRPGYRYFLSTVRVKKFPSRQGSEKPISSR